MDAKQQRYLFIAKTPTDGTPSIADGAAFDPALLENGEVVFVDAGTNLVDTSPTDGKYIIWQKTKDGDLLNSPVFNTNKIDYSNESRYRAATQVVKYIGSNGVTGEFPLNANSAYTVAVKVKEPTKAKYANGQQLFATYATGSSVSEAEIVTYLTKDLTSQAYDKDVKIEVVSDDGGTAVPAGVGTVTVVNGVNVISAATDIDSGGVALIPGNAVRFGTAVTDPIYFIVSTDTTANTATLHAPYQDASGTFVPNTGMEYITAANILAGSLGIKVSGIDDTEWKRNHREYEFTDFNIEIYGDGFDGASLTTLSTGVTGIKPQGDGRQVADLEFRSRQAFSDGMQSPNDSYTNDDQLREANATGIYDLIDLSYYDDSYTGLGAVSRSYVSSTIAVPSLNTAVTIPGTVTSGETYSITADGVTVSFLTTTTSGVTLYNGLLAALTASSIPFMGTASTKLYVSGKTVTVSTNTIAITTAADTAVRYPTWTSLPS